MIIRVVIGMIWGVVLYFGACMVTGAIAGGMVDIDDPDRAYEMGAQAGARAVAALRVYFFFGAVLVATLGTWFGLLPGTRLKRKP